VDVGGVQVIGPLNLAGELPTNASQMFSKNAVTFLQNLLEDGELAINLEDEIVAGSLVAKDGAVVHSVVLEKLEGAR
jgi:NAD(P) transhydrogenase subunit alpha